MLVSEQSSSLSKWPINNNLVWMQQAEVHLSTTGAFLWISSPLSDSSFLCLIVLVYKFLDFAHNTPVSHQAAANIHSSSVVFFIPVCSGNGLAERQVHIWVLCFWYRWKWSVFWKIQVNLHPTHPLSPMIVYDNGIFLVLLILKCFDLCFRGRVCVIVNVASKWGKTRVNYTQLVEMHASYAERGLSILGFPCNQFGGQASSNNSLQLKI